jgi:hypothetical protein
LLALSEAERRWLGQRARRRIRDNFEIGRIAQRYARVWLAAASKDPPSSRHNAVAKAA